MKCPVNPAHGEMVRDEATYIWRCEHASCEFHVSDEEAAITFRVPRLLAIQAELIAELRATGLMGDASDAEIWQAALRVGERHGAGTAKRDPAAVARELGRRE